MNRQQLLEQLRQQSLQTWSQSKRKALHEAVNNAPINPISAAASGASGGGRISVPAIDTGKVYIFVAPASIGLDVNVFMFDTNNQNITQLTNLGGTPFYGIQATAADPINGGVLVFANSTTPPGKITLFRVTFNDNNEYNIEEVLTPSNQGIGGGVGIAVNRENGDVIGYYPDKGTGKNYLKKINGNNETLFEFNYNYPNDLSATYGFSDLCSSEKPGYVNMIYVPSPSLSGVPIPYVVIEVKIPSTPSIIQINPTASNFIINQYSLDGIDIADTGSIYAFNSQVNDFLISYPAILSKNVEGKLQEDFNTVFLGDDETIRIAVVR
jgi:hypothetical protein